MKRRLALNIVGLSPLGLFLPLRKSNTALVNIMRKRWEASKTYTIEVVKLMPAEYIEFSPSENQMTFAQHCIHLGFFNPLFFGFMMDEKGSVEWKDIFGADYIIKQPDEISLFENAYLKERPNEENKNIVIDYLVKTFDFAIQCFDKITDDDLSKGIEKPKPPGPLQGHTNLDFILRGEMHTAHHRAQAIGYMRLKDVQPPSFAEFNML